MKIYLSLLFLFSILSSTAQNKYQSVLNTGKWYKIAIAEKGMYKITFDKLRELGFANPANVRIFGNGGKLLPETNREDRPDDLNENKIIKGSNYILFYAQGPRQQTYNKTTKLFSEKIHPYSDYVYYFITDFNTGVNNEIQLLETPTENPEATITTYDAYTHYEKNEKNVIKTGRKWYGEHFSINLEYTFPFEIKNTIPNTTRLNISMIGRTNVAYSGKSKMQIVAPNLNKTIEFDKIYFGEKTNTFAKTLTIDEPITPNSDKFDVSLKYIKSHSEAEAWLDYICVNSECSLKITSDQFHFRKIITEDTLVCKFKVENAESSTIILDVTDPTNVQKADATLNGTTLTFTAKVTEQREYMAYNGKSFLTPSYTDGLAGEVANQNLHTTGNIDMLILTHSDFKDNALEIANIHQHYDNLDVVVVTNEEVYNEFSSGTPDVSAMRDFARMVYERGDKIKKLRYLLLLGDGSYNNKDKGADATNRILTYQSEESLVPTSSFVTDDFYGLLTIDDNIVTGILDIGVGRLPVFDNDEAEDMVNKIKSYLDADNIGEWKNTLCFVADDADDNQKTHEEDANEIADMVSSKYPGFKIDKIFLDAYEQVGSSSGETYPDVKEAINNRIGKGTLVLNYSGHGGEDRLTQEEVINKGSIDKWANFDRLTIFITATCEFSRFDYIGKDNEKIVTAGEKVILNPKGGAIAMFTTTRVVYAAPNKRLNIAIYDYLFEKDTINNKPYCFGDVIRLAKNATVNRDPSNNRNFTLLGDPALRVKYPETGDLYSIKTTSYNNKAITATPDTLKAFSKMNIKGEIQNTVTGLLHQNFSGKINVKVFDEEKKINTLDNEGAGVFTFNSYPNIIYNGTVEVQNGVFECTFIAPKDISYNYNRGKISYYAYTPDTTLYWQDIHGHFDNFVIGGTFDENNTDSQGPDVELYCTDEYFTSGSLINESPTLYAKLFDNSGINTTGTSIGHDITLHITNEKGFSKTYVLNDFYEGALSDYKSGEIRYSVFNLEDGTYTATIKVWDVFNNSSTAQTTFKVVNSQNSRIAKVLCYPNPMHTQTAFVVEHNQAGTEMAVRIDIHDLYGKLVSTLDTEMPVGTSRTEELIWDGTNNYGATLQNGMYIARIKLTTENGESEFHQLKILINK